jgi:hypothetical protein
MTRLDRVRASGDEGQVMILALGFTVLAILLLTAVVSASGVHLERKRLLALADLTAVSAADAIDESAYYAPGRPAPTESGTVLVLSDASVRRAATDYLASATSSAGLHELRLVAATATDGTVTITLHALARPALLSGVTAPWSDGIDLVATASATTR